MDETWMQHRCTAKITACLFLSIFDLKSGSRCFSFSDLVLKAFSSQVSSLAKNSGWFFRKSLKLFRETFETFNSSTSNNGAKVLTL